MKIVIEPIFVKESPAEFTEAQQEFQKLWDESKVLPQASDFFTTSFSKTWVIQRRKFLLKDKIILLRVTLQN